MLITFYTQAVPPDCGESCFSTEIISQSTTENGCLSYEMRISLNGECAHALSHYTVEIPECANIMGVSNSEGWAQEIAITDPTSGLYGFKIDEIQGFGEDNDDLESFIVNFTICPDASCETDLSCWSPKVAYKAATCVFYEETEFSCIQLAAHIESTDESCFGAADGSALIVIDEGEGPFTYEWSTGATTAQLDNLSAGTYLATVFDSDGNTVELETIISSPEEIVLTASVVNATCAGIANGSIDLTASGGVGNFTYSWSTGANTEDIDGLVSGSYIVTVTDANGCSATERFTVANDINISINAVVTKSSCSEDDGAIDITVSGGTAPYTFTWDNGATTEDLTGLAPNIYRLTVTDANGCTGNKTFVVQENNPISITASTTQTGCVEDNSGSVDITVSGGAEPYSYSWSNGETTEDLTGLAAGIYTVMVTDQNGCSSTLRAVVSSNTFDVSAQISDVSCFGASDGAIELTPSGGVAPYTFSWSNGETGASISGLAATLYRVTVTDATGCEKNLSYYVNEPAELTASATVSNPTCETSGNNIDLTVTGGTGEYAYSWSNGATTQDLTGLADGEYTVDITDSNGCQTSLTITVNATATGCDDGSGDGSTGDGDGSDGDSGDGGTGDGDTGDGGDGSDDGDNNDDGSGGNDGGDGSNGDGDGSDGDDGSDGSDGDTGNDDGSDGDGGDNDDNCTNPFDTEIELIEVEGDCYTYRMTVLYDGNHSYGLSHLSVGLECGTVSDIENEFNWPIEIGTDPTTGISGFKIDDISGFGEGSMSEQFEGTFTICSTDEDCIAGLQAADFEVGYKYGQCVDYAMVDGSENVTSAAITAYPNPFREQATIEIISPVDTQARVELYNQQGHKVMSLFNGSIKANEKKVIQFEASNLVNDMYTYRVITSENSYYGKLVKF